MDALPTDRSILRELLAHGAAVFCLNRFSACITGCVDGLLSVQAAAALEIPLLLSCRAGSRFSWVGTLIMASVHQEDQASLDETGSLPRSWRAPWPCPPRLSCATPTLSRFFPDTLPTQLWHQHRSQRGSPLAALDAPRTRVLQLADQRPGIILLITLTRGAAGAPLRWLPHRLLVVDWDACPGGVF